MHSLKKKLRSQAGETIAEVLVALLIAALSLTMLASMITSTVSMVTRSKEKMKEYYKENQNLETMSAGHAETSNQTGQESQTEPPEEITVTLTADGLSVSIDTLCYKNNTFQGDKTVYAYVKAPEESSGTNDGTSGE